MGTLKSFLDSKSITAKHVHDTSKRIENHGAADRTLLVKRVAKRANKENEKKTYAELNLAKPAAMGRGVTVVQVEAAIAEKPVPRKVRTKILKAVNTILAAKKETAVDNKALFEGTKAKPGKKAKEEAKK